MTTPAKESAATLRSIVDYLAFPASSHEIELALFLGGDSVQRCCKRLQKAGIVTHPLVLRDILGVVQRVPQIHEWRLTEAYRRGEIAFDPEKLAEAI